MIIPILDQDLAVIKAVEIQQRDGSRISDHDYMQLKEAIAYINQLLKKVEEQRSKQDA